MKSAQGVRFVTNRIHCVHFPNMHPVFITLFGRPIAWYGVMAAVGFGVAAVYWSIQARRQGRPCGFGSDLAVWLMAGGLLGARAAYVLANWDRYLAAPEEIVRIDQGGLIYYGGFIGGIAACILFARVRRLPVWATGDFAIIGLPLAHAFGRVGCFLNGCCYGRETTSACSVLLDGVRRQPVQLYESAMNLLVFALLCVYRSRNRRAGTGLALYLTTYPVGRFFLEFLRGDPRLAGPGFNVSQLLSLGWFLVGLALWAGLPSAKGLSKTGSKPASVRSSAA